MRAKTVNLLWFECEVYSERKVGKMKTSQVPHLYLSRCRHCDVWIAQEDLANFKSKLQTHLEKSHRYQTTAFSQKTSLNEFREEFGIIIEKNKDRIQTFKQSWVDNSFFEVVHGQKRKHETETEERIAERGRCLARELIRQMGCVIKEPIRIHASIDIKEKEKASMAWKSLQQVERNEFLSSIGKSRAQTSGIKIRDNF